MWKPLWLGFFSFFFVVGVVTLGSGAVRSGLDAVIVGFFLRVSVPLGVNGCTVAKRLLSSPALVFFFSASPPSSFSSPRGRRRFAMEVRHHDDWPSLVGVDGRTDDDDDDDEDRSSTAARSPAVSSIGTKLSIFRFR